MRGGGGVVIRDEQNDRLIHLFDREWRTAGRFGNYVVSKWVRGNEGRPRLDVCSTWVRGYSMSMFTNGTELNYKNCFMHLNFCFI